MLILFSVARADTFTGFNFVALVGDPLLLFMSAGDFGFGVVLLVLVLIGSNWLSAQINEFDYTLVAMVTYLLSN